MKRVRLLDPCHFLRYGISVHAHLELADSVQGLTGELSLARGPCRPLGALSFRCQPSVPWWMLHTNTVSISFQTNPPSCEISRLASCSTSFPLQSSFGARTRLELPNHAILVTTISSSSTVQDLSNHSLSPTLLTASSFYHLFSPFLAESSRCTSSTHPPPLVSYEQYLSFDRQLLHRFW